MISRPILVIGSVLMQSYQLGSVGWGAWNMWSEQPLAQPAEDVITGLEFLVDLPMRSLVGQQDETKKDKNKVEKFYTFIFFLTLSCVVRYNWHSLEIIRKKPSDSFVASFS